MPQLHTLSIIVCSALNSTHPAAFSLVVPDTQAGHSILLLRPKSGITFPLLSPVSSSSGLCPLGTPALESHSLPHSLYLSLSVIKHEAGVSVRLSTPYFLAPLSSDSWGHLSGTGTLLCQLVGLWPAGVADTSVWGNLGLLGGLSFSWGEAEHVSAHTCDFHALVPRGGIVGSTLRLKVRYYYQVTVFIFIFKQNCV